MDGLEFKAMKLKWLWLMMAGAVACLTPSLGLADLTINDPTRPVYKQSVEIQRGLNGIALEPQQQMQEIPPLTQLLFSKSRKIAFFGELLVRAGDITDFGTVLEIKADRVFVRAGDTVQEVLFFDDDKQNKES